MVTVGVTGAAGFVAGHLVASLLARGYSVIGTVRSRMFLIFPVTMDQDRYNTMYGVEMEKRVESGKGNKCVGKNWHLFAYINIYTFSVCLSVCLSVSLSLSLSLCVSLSLSLSFSVSASFSVSVSFSVSLSLSLSLSVSLSVSLFLCVSLSLCLSFSVSLFLCLCLFLCFSLCLSPLSPLSPLYLSISI